MSTIADGIEIRRFAGTYLGSDGAQIAVDDDVETVFADLRSEPVDFEEGDLVVLYAAVMDDGCRFQVVSLQRARAGTPRNS